LLAETRKFNLSIVLVTQFLDALTDGTRAALLGNAKTIAAFRCNPTDAQILARNFDRLHQEFNQTSLLELDDGEAMIAVTGHEAARVTVPAPRELHAIEKVRQQSRRHYGSPRAEVEGKIQRALGYAHSLNHRA
jgi:hypothetical protein